MDQVLDRREQRHAEMRERIVAAAWAAADEHGIATLTLRHVADRLGMRPPSLYEYVEGKDAIYDLLFRDGYRRLAEDLERTWSQSADLDDRPARLARSLTDFLAFCRSNPARYQLMFTRAVPGWEPGADAYAASLDTWARMEAALRDIGITEPEDLDLYVALGAGLAVQQDANDPQGQRYASLAPSAARMFLSHLDQEVDR